MRAKSSTPLQANFKQILKEFHILQLHPKIGAELEFYLISDDQNAVSNTVKKLALDYQIDKEKGHNQFECVVNYTEDIEALVETLRRISSDIHNTAQANGATANFSAKALADDYGSALHLHLSLHDIKGNNIFAPLGYNDNQPLQHTIAGILELAEESIYLLCPNEQDYQRFVPNFMAPTTLSWGGNNRTTIVRIPDSEAEFRRIEYRLPPASADPALAVQILLLSAHYGLKNQLIPPDRTYGLAHDNQYKLPRLPTSLPQAQSSFENKMRLKKLLF